jgi:citronellyl-CoA synthetase
VALINTNLTGQALAHSIAIAGAEHAIVGAEMQDEFESARAFLEKAPHGWVLGGGELDTRLAAASDADPGLAARGGLTARDRAFFIYTSGTTGLPKAAIISHGRWTKVYHGMGLSLQLNRRDTLYCTLPLYHGTALVACWASVLQGGAAIALRRRFSASEFWSDCRHFGATAFGYVGELCRYLMARPAAEGDSAHRVRKMVGNGLRPTIWADFKQRFGVETVMEFYGSSEGNIGFTNIFNFNNTVGFCPLPYAVVAWDAENERPIRDGGRMRRVMPGETGLLIGEITARNQFEGYTDPAKNAACILTDVFADGDRWFNTGDLVRDLGFRHAQFVDRTGDTFRWKGENVSTTEVENAIASAGGLQAVVYGVEIPHTNGRAGMASVVSESRLDLAALHAHLARELPAYALPLFLRESADIATTATFKPQKAALKKAGFDPAQVAPDKLYVLLPESAGYVPLTAKIHQRILAGEYRF